MKRYLLAAPLLLAAIACPRDKKETTDSIPVDTAALAAGDTVDLSGVKSNIPSAAPDTFRERELRAPRGDSRGGDVQGGLPAAPEPLLETVQREEAVSRFCFTEFGKKTDPALRGNVTMIVTIGSTGVSDARVGASNWSGAAGTAVNRCLNERAERAWNVAPGAVRPGRYSVRLSFTG